MAHHPRSFPDENPQRPRRPAPKHQLRKAHPGDQELRQTIQEAFRKLDQQKQQKLQQKKPGNKPAAAPKNLVVTITGLNEAGFGLAQKNGQTILVPRTAVGDQAVVTPPRTQERWSSADLVEVLQPGPGRILPPCPAFSAGCGGCQWQHLDYPAQLDWKEKTVATLLHGKAGYRGMVNSILGMAMPEGYRNKLSLKTQDGRLVFVPEIGEKPLAPDDCPVQTPALRKAWRELKRNRMHPAIEQIHLRSNAQGQVGLHVFAKEAGPNLDAALKHLVQDCPGAVGLGVTTRQGYRVVGGEAVLAQTLGTVTWLIPHNGFFQTNQEQAGVLLDLVRRQARLTKQDRLLDLYCGAGFFGLALAGEAGEVLGIEENAQAVLAAEASAKHSGIGNVRFLSGDLGPVLARQPAHPSEVAVVDPPREGLLPQAVQALIERRPHRIVYISCYAPSLVRDYKLLAAAGWKGVDCTPLDMFPHTSHVETILTLERSKV